MLFIDDYQPKVMINNIFLEQSVSTNDYFRLALGDLPDRFEALFTLHLRRQPGDRNTQRCQPLCKIDEMLFSENLCWRHDANLHIVFDCL